LSTSHLRLQCAIESHALPPPTHLCCPSQRARPEIVGCAVDHRLASSADDQQARPRSTGHFPRTLLSVQPAAGAPADCGWRLASQPRLPDISTAHGADKLVRLHTLGEGSEGASRTPRACQRRAQWRCDHCGFAKIRHARKETPRPHPNPSPGASVGILGIL